MIQKYLFWQILKPVLSACAALAGIGILSQSLDQLELIVERGQSVALMLKLTLLAVPQLMSVIVPIGLFVGAAIALTRMQREQEITAVFAAGITRWQAISPAVRIAGFATIMTMAITTLVQPWSQHEARNQAFSVRADFASLLVEEGQFVEGPDGLTVYVQQIEQSGLLRNLFIYIPGEGNKDAVTWDAAEARFERVDGLPVITMINATTTRYSSNGVLTYGSFDRNVFDLSPYTSVNERVRYKPSDLYLTQLLNPSPQELKDVGPIGELTAEAHSRLSAPLYAIVAMAMALTACLGGAYSRTGYGLRIAKAACGFLIVRVVGYGLVAASAWNGWLNIFQYVLPIVAAAISFRLLFRALKPRRRPHWMQMFRLTPN